MLWSFDCHFLRRTDDRGVYFNHQKLPSLFLVHHILPKFPLSGSAPRCTHSCRQEEAWQITFFVFCLILLGNRLQNHTTWTKKYLIFSYLLHQGGSSHYLFRFLLHIHGSPAETPDFTLSGDWALEKNWDFHVGKVLKNRSGKGYRCL